MADSWFYDTELVRLRGEWVAAVRELGRSAVRRSHEERLAAEQRVHDAAEAYFDLLGRLRRTRV